MNYHEFKKSRFKIVMMYPFTLPLLIMLWVSLSAIINLPATQDEPSDSISGTYFMHGKKISEIYSCTFNCFDMEPARDTTTVSFTTNVWLVPEKTDTLRFIGLMGADSGEAGQFQFSEFLFPIELHDEEQYKIYGRLKDDSDFEIELWLTGARYNGSGSFQNKTIQLQGIYQYRNRSFAYELEGVRIEVD